MSGSWIFILLFATAVLPLVVVFIWFRAAALRITLPWFLSAIAAGVISLLAAAFIQSLFPQPLKNELGQMFFSVFIRIAMVEETSRLFTLIPLVLIARHMAHSRKGSGLSFAAALGLAAGLGFAAAENASYGMADINIALLRVFTAAPLHGACGMRVAAAVSMMNQNPPKAIFLFASAVIIHGAYNLMIISPPIPSILAVAVALMALFVSVAMLKADKQ